MPKKGFINCPECGAEVSKEKLGRHLRKVHPKKAAEHGVVTQRPVRRSRGLSERKIEMLEHRHSQDMKKNAAIVVVVVILVVAVSLTGFYWNTIFPKKHNPVVVIETSVGTIKIEVYKDKVPNTADNFIKYVDAHFYEGLIFHRIANLDASNPETHIVQGGGFDESMKQKTALYGPINLEINNALTHNDGAVAMARTTEPNSATSQFYICDGPQHFLDDASTQASGSGRGYAVFGHVTYGMNIVRAMGKVAVHTSGSYENVPVDPITMDNVYVES